MSEHNPFIFRERNLVLIIMYVEVKILFELMD